MPTRPWSSGSWRLIQYVDGDYGALETFKQLRKLLDTAQHPLHYLAIPPSMFPVVVTQLAAADCDKGARVVDREALRARSGQCPRPEPDAAPDLR